VDGTRSISATTEREETTVAGVVDDLLAGGKKYLSSLGNIFYQNPELLEDLDLPLVRQYGGKMFACAQLFMGGPNTGTSFHCAEGTTLFVMVHGEKRWTLVHPAHTLWMSPSTHPTTLYAYTTINHNAPADVLERDVPLYAYVPKYVTDLKPGDVLFLPAWWWHAIDNLTPATIGVSTRWATMLLPGNGSPFPLLRWCSWDAIKIRLQVIRGGYVTDDYHLLQFDPGRRIRR
jgi:hypothetical protein